MPECDAILTASPTAALMLLQQRRHLYTRDDFERDFPTAAACLEWLKDFRWPEGITCPECERVTGHSRGTKGPYYACNQCGWHTHPTAGTIYHKSSVSLVLWFEAVFLVASTRCGISAKQLERELGVSYKTARRMLKLIRSQIDTFFVAHDVPQSDLVHEVAP